MKRIALRIHKFGTLGFKPKMGSRGAVAKTAIELLKEFKISVIRANS